MIYPYENSFSSTSLLILYQSVFKILAILLGAEWYVVVILFCISLIIIIDWLGPIRKEKHIVILIGRV